MSDARDVKLEDRYGKPVGSPVRPATFLERILYEAVLERRFGWTEVLTEPPYSGLPWVQATRLRSQCAEPERALMAESSGLMVAAKW